MAGPHAGVEQVGLQEDLAVGDGDDVGRNVGRDVVGLGLNDRQAGQRAAAQVVRQLGAPLQQPGVQVEDVARVGLAARRAAQQQRDRPVGLGLLGQVVEDDQHVLARVHPVLADRRPGVGGDVLVACRVGGGTATMVVYSIAPALLQRLPHLGGGGALLADRRRRCSLTWRAGSPDSQLAFWLMIVSMAMAVLPVCRSPMISSPLAAADRGHRVDRLDARSAAAGSPLAAAPPRACSSSARSTVSSISPLPSSGTPSGSDHPAEEAVADRDRQHLAGPAHLLAFLDLAEVAEDDHADLARRPG